jgi:hypothetical protein
MDKLIIGLIGVGTLLLALGIAISIPGMAVVGVIFLGVGILLTRVIGQS